MASVSGYGGLDDWEIANYEGFVFKHKKRRRLDPASSSSADTQPPDPMIERRKQREWKKRALQKLNDKYAMELSRWELWSNTLEEMESRTRTQHKLNSSMALEVVVSRSEEHPAPDPSRRSIMDDLRTQVEAQEAIIRDVSRLCDLAEVLCSEEDERRKHQRMNLPIWDLSPEELMAVLCEPQEELCN